MDAWVGLRNLSSCFQILNICFWLFLWIDVILKTILISDKENCAVSVKCIKGNVNIILIQFIYWVACSIHDGTLCMIQEFMRYLTALILIVVSLWKWLVQGQGCNARKVIQRCTHLLYCNVPSLGCNVNRRRMWKPEMRSIFHIKNQWNIQVICELSKFNAFILLGYILSEHWCIYSCLEIPPRENWFQCTQSIRNCNQLSLHYNLVHGFLLEKQSRKIAELNT